MRQQVVAISMMAILAGGGRGLDVIPGTKGQLNVVLENGGHFLQEDDPQGFIDALIPWLNETKGTPR